MTMLRMTGLLCAAFMTMGSGGVPTAPEEAAQVSHEPGTAIETAPESALEPEYIDEQVDAAASAAVEKTEVATGASGQTWGAPVPPTAVEMAGQGKAIELALSDDYLQGRYYTGGGILGFDQATGHIGAYFSDNRDIIANVGLMTDRTPLFIDGLTLSAGARGYLALLSDPDDDVVGLAPGIEGRYGLPYNFPVAIVGNLFYSPDVLTLGDAENIVDIDLRVEAEVIPDIVGFIGFREFRFDSDEGSDKKAANEFQIGARFAL